MPRPAHHSDRELFRLFQAGHPLKFATNDPAALSSGVEETLRLMAFVLTMTRFVKESLSSGQGLAQDCYP
jgi:hypothetical protein